MSRKLGACHASTAPCFKEYVAPSHNHDVVDASRADVCVWRSFWPASAHSTPRARATRPAELPGDERAPLRPRGTTRRRGSQAGASLCRTTHREGACFFASWRAVGCARRRALSLSPVCSTESMALCLVRRQDSLWMRTATWLPMAAPQAPRPRHCSTAVATRCVAVATPPTSSRVRRPCQVMTRRLCRHDAERRALLPATVPPATLTSSHRTFGRRNAWSLRGCGATLVGADLLLSSKWPEPVTIPTPVVARDATCVRLPYRALRTCVLPRARH